MANWLTADDAEALAYLWPDAPTENPDVLAMYLDSAKDACIAYAPELPADADGIPTGWQLAQALQARNTYNSGAVGPGGDTDGGGYGLTTFPLDWQVQQLLRPRRAMGAIL